MKPYRKTIVRDHKIEEFYWCGRMVTYIDNRQFVGSYEEAIKSVNCEDGEGEK